LDLSDIVQLFVELYWVIFLSVLAVGILLLGCVLMKKKELNSGVLTSRD